MVTLLVCQGRARSTMVFWNVNQCPIPTDVLLSVRPTIRSVLDGMGLHGSLEIYAYGNKSLLDQKHVFREARICYCVEREQLPDADIEEELKNAGIGGELLYTQHTPCNSFLLINLLVYCILQIPMKPIWTFLCSRNRPVIVEL